MHPTWATCGSASLIKDRTTEWAQVGLHYNREPEGELFGRVLSLSADTTTVGDVWAHRNCEGVASDNRCGHTGRHNQWFILHLFLPLLLRRNNKAVHRRSNLQRCFESASTQPPTTQPTIVSAERFLLLLHLATRTSEGPAPVPSRTLTEEERFN